MLQAGVTADEAVAKVGSVTSKEVMVGRCEGLRDWVGDGKGDGGESEGKDVCGRSVLDAGGVEGAVSLLRSFMMGFGVRRMMRGI